VATWFFLCPIPCVYPYARAFLLPPQILLYFLKKVGPFPLASLTFSTHGGPSRAVCCPRMHSSMRRAPLECLSFRLCVLFVLFCFLPGHSLSCVRRSSSEACVFMHPILLLPHHNTASPPRRWRYFFPLLSVAVTDALSRPNLLKYAVERLILRVRPFLPIFAMGNEYVYWSPLFFFRSFRHMEK